MSEQGRISEYTVLQADCHAVFRIAARVLCFLVGI